MPRRGRIESRTSFYHVIMRGNNKNWIYKKNKYKLDFLTLLKEQEESDLIGILAWCIMNNHVHLVLKASLSDLTLAMRKINTSIAMKYNVNETTIGHVFQDRFKSQPIETEAYLLEVVRYVHNNPVKANLVKNVNDYTWSSYHSFFKEKEVQQNKHMQFIMNYFNNDLAEFKAFHMKSDFNDYLEIKEDSLLCQEERAKRIIEAYRSKNGGNESNLKSATQEIVTELIKNSGMPLRKIADLLNIPYSQVRKINCLIKEKP